MIAGELTNRDYSTAEPYTSISNYILPLLSNKYLVVMAKGIYKGILTLKDVILNPKKLVIDCMTEKTHVDFHSDAAETSQVLKDKGISAAPVFKNKHFYGVITIDNINRVLHNHETDMSQYLKKIEKLNNFNILTTGVLHDVNNVLMVLFNDAEFLKKILPDQCFKENIDRIIRGLSEIRLMVQGIFNYSREGTIKKTAAIHDIISDTATFFLKGKPIRLKLDINPDLNSITVERKELSQVLSNIIVNAIQAMPDGGIISIKVENIIVKHENKDIPLKKGNFIKLLISDTGYGIDKKNINKIFELFFTTKPAGNGIGLFLCKYILTGIGGDISVKSEPGSGTKIIIYYPYLLEK